MPTFSKTILNGSTDGKNITLGTDTGTNATLIHTATATVNGLDEVWLWATNISSNTLPVNIQFGGVETSDQVSASLAPSDGIILLIPGWCLRNGNSVTGFTSAPDSININGFVNRIDP